ncbi:general secretion pathway protein GspK [Thalassotalea euphylliae]|uniref:general secretion pathway protein GspK n=1 Tax=Thalassotalea euphylliae TaxID=1655234 RepID=UPI0015F259CB|nr:type II secretion system protein GspK [Thalassotalea euphylliae]
MSLFKQQGLALIQVLLLSAIISVIAIQITKTARTNVSVASDFKDRIKAELLMTSAENKILAELFRLDAHQIHGSEINGVTWRLGKAFKLENGTEVKIQPLSGRLSLLTSPQSYLKKLLVASGASQEEAASLYSAIMDWIDADSSVRQQGAEANSYEGIIVPRNGPLQHISELRSIKGMTQDIYVGVSENVTIYATSFFNPVFATLELNQVLFGDDVANAIESDKLTGNGFTESDWQLLVGGQNFNYIDFNPGTLHEVNVKVEVGDVTLSRTMKVKSQNQSSITPFVVLSRQ